MNSKTILLNAQQAATKITRLAYEIYENTIHSQQLVLAGIEKNGLAIAKLLQIEISKIHDIEIQVIQISINKHQPTQCEIDMNFSLENAEIIVVDDVANSGRTLLYGLQPFLKAMPSRIQIAVLVDRKHKQFPVTPDYVGVQLSTTLQEHIEVVIQNGIIEQAHIV
jgi:pyrimidine operon attenuation protein/uracil phosphoribosyltransferase